MKSYCMMLLRCLPLAIGIVLSLLSIAFTVKVVDGNADDNVVAAVMFALLGFPLLIASTISLTKKISEDYGKPGV